MNFVIKHQKKWGVMVGQSKGMLFILSICIIISISLFIMLIVSKINYQKKTKCFFKEIKLLKKEAKILKYIVKQYSKTIRKLQNQVQKDDMTGLFTRVTMQKMIEETLLNLECSLHAFVIVDIDNFKNINDSFGHMIGDEALVIISNELRKLFQESVIGRIGGDEFVVFMKNIETIPQLIQKLNVSCKPIHVNKKQHKYSISMSMGIAVYPKDGATFQELYKNADRALYISKSTGKGKYCFYEK